MNIKQKSEGKNLTNKFTDFLQSNFVKVKRFFAVIYLNRDDVSSTNNGAMA